MKESNQESNQTTSSCIVATLKDIEKQLRIRNEEINHLVTVGDFCMVKGKIAAFYIDSDNKKQLCVWLDSQYMYKQLHDTEEMCRKNFEYLKKEIFK